MANNRLWLVCPTAGLAICLAKRMGTGWYLTNPEMKGDQLQKFLDRSAAASKSETIHDNFQLAMEDSPNPSVCLTWQCGKAVGDGAHDFRIMSVKEFLDASL